VSTFNKIVENTEHFALFSVPIVLVPSREESVGRMPNQTFYQHLSETLDIMHFVVHVCVPVGSNPT